MRGSERNEIFIIDPLEKIHTFRYYCSNRFNLTPLEDLIKEKEIFGIIVIGRKRSAIGILNGDRLELLNESESGISGKFNAGGQSQKRLKRLREEGEKHFYRRISIKVNSLFLPLGLAGIFIGGTGFSKHRFIRFNKIDYRLKNKIMKIVDTDYDGGIEGLRSVILRIKDELKEVKYIKDKNLLQGILDELAKDSGIIIYGKNEIINSLKCGKIKELLIDKDFTDMEEISLLSEQKGTLITIISSECEEREMLNKTFDGIIGILYYTRE
jgi:peptide chain release factor subunit 1